MADKFSYIAQMFDVQADMLTQSVADAEAQNQPLAAGRLAVRRVGWTKWSPPRAPQAEGTRKVV